ncbi:MAG: hypothetical protein JJU11_12925 [Candidatus Sumerlaeia bacterium]|nr:hypothetical protein [Candidatus Sumerlaeia bacterium]
MRNSFKTTATGFLAAATLLGGSAFAFAPEFVEDLPTVIITERLENPDDSFDVASDAFVFRYSDAFELLPLLDPRGNTESELKYLFNEFEFANPIPLEPIVNAPGTPATAIMINGNNAFATPGNEFPEAADFASAPNVVTGGNSFLTFRNRDFSGENETQNTGWSSVGQNSGWNLETDGPQKRVISLYVKGDTNDDYTMSDNTFVVITALTDGEQYFWDDLSGSVFTDPVFTDPFEEELVYDDDFGGWIYFPITQFSILDLGGDTRVQTPQPAYNAANASLGHANTGGTANAGVDTMILNVNGQAGGAQALLALGVGGVDLEADKLYRMRATWSTPNAAKTETIRTRFGETFDAGTAVMLYDSAALAGGGPDLPRTVDTQDVYLLTKGAATDTAIWFDVLTLGGNGQDLHVHAVSLASAERSQLGTPNVIFNHGAENVPTLAAGEGPTPPSGSAPFDLTSTVGTGVLTGTVGGAQFPFSFTTSGDAITLNIAQQTVGDNDGFAPFQGTNPATAGFAPPGFGRFALAEGGPATEASTPGTFTADSGSLYIVDYYLSSPTTNTRPRGGPVEFRVGNRVGGTKIFEHVYALADAGVAATAAPRIYSGVFGGEDGNVVMVADFLGFGSAFVAAATGPAQTYIIHRVVVNEYVID